MTHTMSITIADQQYPDHAHWHVYSLVASQLRLHQLQLHQLDVAASRLSGMLEVEHFTWYGSLAWQVAGHG